MKIDFSRIMPEIDTAVLQSHMKFHCEHSYTKYKHTFTCTQHTHYTKRKRIARKQTHEHKRTGTHTHTQAVEMTVYFDWFLCTESAVVVVLVFPPLFVYLFVCYHFKLAQQCTVYFYSTFSSKEGKSGFFF